MKLKFIINLYNMIDRKLKFPNLKKGEIGIQVGFDMSSSNRTTDLIKMYQCVGKNGLVIGIDPDPFNVNEARRIIQKYQMNINIVEKATYSQKGKTKLILTRKSSWNRIDLIDADDHPAQSDNKIEVEVDTLDSIIDDLKIDIKKISHVSITNNGAEYQTLRGMVRIFRECDNLSMTVITGRPGKIGLINGDPDYSVIVHYLHQQGFKTKFFRINKSFWWGFINLLIIKRRWIYSQKKHGVVVAVKGNKKIKFYQSFS